MPCTYSPHCQGNDADDAFQILHIVFQELVRKFKVCLSTIHPIITTLVSIILFWATMSVKYAAKGYENKMETMT